MPMIIPIKELKNTSSISDICHNATEPIFITKNGYGDMVLMSMEFFEANMQRERIYRELEISEKQIVEGKVHDPEEAIGKLRDKYGL